MTHEMDWYRDLVIYQIYPRSFKDGNGDGIGDLAGMTEKLDYLKELGITAVWMSPVFASPNVDNGYDISDYFRIMDKFGSMKDWETFRDGAHERGIAIIMDLVLNHTSDQHRWFKESRRSRTNPYSDYYVWADPDPEGNPPNQWQSVFGGSAWEYVPERGQYYLHLFAKEQPDLNWDNEKAREEIFDIIRFWNEKGVDGYRVDAISYLDKGLDGRADFGAEFGTAGCVNLIGTHRYIQEMAAKTFSPGRLMSVGEVNINCDQDLLQYSAKSSGEFHMSIPFVPPIVEIETWSPKKLKADLERDYNLLAGKGWWARFLSNHDKPRQVSLYGDDGKYRKESAKMLACFLHTLPGTPFIYQGEELGMTNVHYPSIEEYDDIDTRNYYRTQLEKGVSRKDALTQAQNISRDNARTPMQWDDSVYGGFSTAKPWLSVNPNYKEINAADQLQDSDSVFSFYKRLIALRRQHPVMAHGDFHLCCPKEGSIIAYTRTLNKETWMAVHNFSAEPQDFFWSPELPDRCAGKILMANYPEDDRRLQAEVLHLQPYETLLIDFS